MEAIRDLLKLNEVIVYFVYGLSFFTLGLAAALQSRRHSRLLLADYLIWLAAFGIVHAMNEWAHIFIPIQASYLPSETVAALEASQTVILAFSFFFLFQFGAMVAFPNSGRWASLRWLPAGMLLAWLALSVRAGATSSDGLLMTLRLPTLEGWARVMLGFTGAVTASLGMLRQAELVDQDMESPHLAWYFRWTALCLGFYAIVAGLLPPQNAWLGSGSVPQLLKDIVTVPGPVLRSIAGLGVAIGVIRGLEVFELETEQFIRDGQESERRWGELQRQEGERSDFLKHVIAAQEEERRRVARELHDETGQKLSAVIMGLGAAAEALSSDPREVGEMLQGTRDVAIDALNSIRQTIMGLRPTLLDDLGLIPALRRLADDISTRSSMEIRILPGDLDWHLPSETEVVLFRVLQEAMMNAARHSRASHVEVRVVRSDSDISAVLEDDGMGFDPGEVTGHAGNGRGLGLAGMRERASLAGGEVTVDSVPGRGTRVHVRLPLEERT